MKWYFIVLIAIAVGVIGFVAGRVTENQVVDADGNPVRGKFISADGGNTATKKAA